MVGGTNPNTNVQNQVTKERLRTALQELGTAGGLYNAAGRLLTSSPSGPLVPDELAALRTNYQYLPTIHTSLQRRYDGGESMFDDPDYPVIASQLTHLTEMDVYNGAAWDGTVKRRD